MDRLREDAIQGSIRIMMVTWIIHRRRRDENGYGRVRWNVRGG